MSGLADIGIEVHARGIQSSVPDHALPILTEIQAMLEEFTASKQPNSIDLRRLPLSSHDYEKLRAILGEGEVSATANCMGPTNIRETAVACVWWITHHNTNDEIIGEFIEVTDSPEILKAHPDDVPAGLRLLRERLSQTPASVSNAPTTDRLS